MISSWSRRVLIMLVIGGIFGLYLGLVSFAQQTITVMVPPCSDQQSIKPLAKEFEKLTGIEVKIESSADAKQTLMTAFAAGSTRYDAFLGFPYDSDYEDAGFIVSLDGSYDPELKVPADYLEDIAASIRGYLTYKGKMYWIPYSIDVTGMAYRTDLVKEAGFPGRPITWDDLLVYATKLTKDTDGDGTIDIWGYAFPFKPDQGQNELVFKTYLWTNGGDFTDESGLLAFDSPRGVEALQLLIDMRNKYHIVPPAVTTYDDDRCPTLFRAGKFAMSFDFTYTWRMCNSPGEPLEGKMEWIPHPYRVKPAARVAGGAWAIPISSTKKDLAWKFITFMGSSESQKFMQLMGLDFSPLLSMYSDPEILAQAKEEGREFLYEMLALGLKTGTPVPKFRGKGEVDIIMSKYIDKAVAGEISPEEALEKAVTDGNKVIERGR